MAAREVDSLRRLYGHRAPSGREVARRAAASLSARAEAYGRRGLGPAARACDEAAEVLRRGLPGGSRFGRVA